MERLDASDRLHELLEEEAAAAGIAVTLTRSKLNGFGLTAAAVLEVEAHDSQSSLLLWHERGNDFWLELGEDLPTAAWWSRGDDLRLLADCVLAILVGDFAIRRGRVTVHPRGVDPITLAEGL